MQDIKEGKECRDHLLKEIEWVIEAAHISTSHAPHPILQACLSIPATVVSSNMTLSGFMLSYANNSCRHTNDLTPPRSSHSHTGEVNSAHHHCQAKKLYEMNT